MHLPDPQRSQVVLLGTSSYEDGRLPNLPAVGRSIGDLAAALTDPVYGLVPEDHCTVLADEGDIRLLGRRLRQAARQAEDLLLVYYAGHGLVGGRRHELYLALPDSEWIEPEFNSLEYDKLRSAVLDSPAATKVIILDCCFSGRVVTDTMADAASEVIGQIEVDGTCVLASAQRDEVALVIPGEDHTAFTGRLLRLLHEGIPGGRELLTVDDLYRQLVARMQAEGLPHPQRRGTDLTGSLALARNRAYTATKPFSPELPDITVDQAIAELDAMIGLEPVKNEIRQFIASVEAARRRVAAGYPTEKPMQHFVFLGSPGTGKTSVARIIAKIYYAFGLLETPNMIEAQRADLVGEYLGATAIKTNELIDAALGGVLFIDEAHSLVNDSEGHTDRFGNEAIQALLRRAEDDREHLVIILAGYQRQMESFLASDPALNPRFPVRVRFPGYSPAELVALAHTALAQRGVALDGEAARSLTQIMDDVGRHRIIDELGNGRFVRNLLERAGQIRDLRVMAHAAEPTASELMTLKAEDLERAFAELTSGFRGYVEVPTLEAALHELDKLVGLEPVKRQLLEIVARLRMTRLRDRQGLATQPPPRHFVFTGPPGTGKTTVARILGGIFAALGLVKSPTVMEAYRADLVGDHLGSTAIKTGKLIDSTPSGVLLIDDASSLYSPGYSGGSEAVAALLKLAEDDRLVIVLTGYPQDMDRFLRSNPALASRYSVQIPFPSYTPGELAQIMNMLAEQAGDSFDPDALSVIDAIFRDACEEGRIDELGNGRFARSLFERACVARDLRVADLGEAASAAELTTVTAADLYDAVDRLTRAPRRES
jgi:SpoVK/Ycf46/Vps4 family AAA+-type ATPase